VISLVLSELVMRWIDPCGISYHRSVHLFLDAETGAVEKEPQEEAPALPYLLRADHEFQGAFHARSNGLRMRGPPAQREKTEGVFRALFLGDSVTFGLGVDDGECFVDLLRKHFQGRSRAVEVLNAGCPGYNGVHEYLFFDRYAADLGCDLVILCFIFDDLPRQPTPEERTIQATEQRSWAFRAFASSWGENLYLKQLLKHSYFVHLQSKGTLDAVFGIGRSGHNEAAWAQYLVVLDQIARRVTENGTRFAVMSFAPEPFLEEHCRKNDWPVLCCLEDIGEYTVDLRLSRVDAHPNRRGHRLIADRLIAALERLRLFPE